MSWWHTQGSKWHRWKEHQFLTQSPKEACQLKREIPPPFVLVNFTLFCSNYDEPKEPVHPGHTLPSFLKPRLGRNLYIYKFCGSSFSTKSTYIFFFSCYTMVFHFHIIESQNYSNQLGSFLVIYTLKHPNVIFLARTWEGKSHVESECSQVHCVQLGRREPCRGALKFQSKAIISCNRTQSNFSAIILSRKTIILQPYN